MRQYLIDELRVEDQDKLRNYFKKNSKESGFDDIFWIELPNEILNSIQKDHTDCMPFYVAVDLEETFISIELLIRTRKSMRCECISYADNNQRDWILEHIDSIFNKLSIIY
ncbi:MAG: hypothetical protein GY760_08870 [Deltaproteobacteria bacterium]|nr:hypothetical protein [Deltaproteobacteria bacterium]